MEYNLKVNMNEYLPLRDVVFNTLRDAISKGELEPGERLMEIQLAERLGVSRTPIREAIRKLELEGLVLMIPRKGAEVAKISAPFSGGAGCRAGLPAHGCRGVKGSGGRSEGIYPGGRIRRDHDHGGSR